MAVSTRRNQGRRGDDAEFDVVGFGSLQCPAQAMNPAPAADGEAAEVEREGVRFPRQAVGYGLAHGVGVGHHLADRGQDRVAAEVRRDYPQ
jgi:hypothetical protein